MTDDILNDATNKQDEPAQVADQPTDLLSTIKRPDGSPKYDNVDKALEALVASQEYIAKLEAENGQLRNTASRVESIETLLERMQANNAPAQQPQGEPTSSQPTLSTDKIAEIARQTLQQETAMQAKKANGEKFNKQMVATYGEKAREVLMEAAQKNGVSMEWVKANAVTNPDFTMRALGLTQSNVVSTTPRSTFGQPVNQQDPEPEVGDFKNTGEYFKALSEWMRRQS